MKHKLVGKFSMIKHRAAQGCSAASALFFSTAALAVNNDVSLPSADSGYLQKIITWMQDVMNVVGGAGTLFIAFLSACAAILMWVAIPKQGGAALAWVLRVCIGAVGAFNLALLFAWLQA
ncbi:TPA: hypothetical protein ACHR7L_004866 [Yersinia enterocolitica]|uniref:hypothetical protein n=1 Tax=Yersiniaceae TaxID=1903411 RepID=UPI00376E72B8|nr:hypothetical protein [Yersinia enterocolitica]